MPSKIARVLNNLGRLGRVGKALASKPGARKFRSAMLDVSPTDPETKGLLTPLERLERAYPNLQFEIAKGPRGLPQIHPLLKVRPVGRHLDNPVEMAAVERSFARDDLVRPSQVISNAYDVRPFEDELFPRDYYTRNKHERRRFPGDDEDLFTLIDTTQLSRGFGLGSEIYPALWEYSKLIGLPNISTVLTSTNQVRRPINMINAQIRGLGFRDVIPTKHVGTRLNLPFTQRWLQKLDTDTQLGVLLADELASASRYYKNPFDELGISNIGELRDPFKGVDLSKKADKVHQSQNLRSDFHSSSYGPTSLRRAAILKPIMADITRGRPVEEILEEVGELPREATYHLFKRRGGYVDPNIILRLRALRGLR